MGGRNQEGIRIHWCVPRHYVSEIVLKTYNAFSVNYLLSYRLQWGQPDTISLLRSSLDPTTEPNTPAASENKTRPIVELPPLPPDAPAYFHADMPKELYYVAMNDWPYSGGSKPGAFPVHDSPHHTRSSPRD